MNKVSLIAFYGEKPEKLKKIFSHCQQLIQQSALKSFFIPYSLEQIHTTLIGLEMTGEGFDLYNSNFYEQTGKYKKADFTQFKEIILRYFPMNLRIGGFLSNNDDFLSFGRKPYERSFSINRKTGKAVIIGWPHTQNDFTAIPLLNFRNHVKDRCNIAHKYSNDNDFYFVLGDVDIHAEMNTEFNSKPDQLMDELALEMRDYLSLHPVDVHLTIDSIQLIQYTDTRVPISSTRMYRISGHWENLPGFIAALYTR